MMTKSPINWLWIWQTGQLALQLRHSTAESRTKFCLVNIVWLMSGGRIFPYIREDIFILLGFLFSLLLLSLYTISLYLARWWERSKVGKSKPQRGAKKKMAMSYQIVLFVIINIYNQYLGNYILEEILWVVWIFGHFAVPPINYTYMCNWVTHFHILPAHHSKIYLCLFNFSCWGLTLTLTVICSYLENRSKLPAGVYPCNRKFQANTCDITKVLAQTVKTHFCSGLQEVLEPIPTVSGWDRSKG